MTLRGVLNPDHFSSNLPLNVFSPTYLTMPPRLNKRQLREQEELHALQDPAHDVAEDQSEPASPSKLPLGGFAAVSFASLDQGRN